MHPEQLGPYRIVRKLGEGAMGTVYKAVDEQRGMVVAVKVLVPSLARRQGFRFRFEAEIESLRKLDHPNIVRLFGFGEQAGQLFYGMEYVEGATLDEEIKAGRRFDWRDVVEIGKQIGRALKHAHDSGIIHRDIKPSNLMLTVEGQIKLTDFGIARLYGLEGMTMEGGTIGTASYMAPEQAGGGKLTAAADFYALGGVFYALLSGRPPLVAHTLPEMIRKLSADIPEPVTRYAREVPVELERVIASLLLKDPGERIGHAGLLLRSLRAVEDAVALRQTARPVPAAVLEAAAFQEGSTAALAEEPAVTEGADKAGPGEETRALAAGSVAPGSVDAASGAASAAPGLSSAVERISPAERDDRGPRVVRVLPTSPGFPTPGAPGSPGNPGSPGVKGTPEIPGAPGTPDKSAPTRLLAAEAGKGKAAPARAEDGGGQTLASTPASDHRGWSRSRHAAGAAAPAGAPDPLGVTAASVPASLRAGTAGDQETAASTVDPADQRTIFLTAEEAAALDEQRRQLEQRSRPKIIGLGSVAAVVVLLLVAGAGIYFSRPPSANALYREVMSLKANQNEDAARVIRRDIELFALHYPQDPRNAELQPLRAEADLTLLQARSRVRAKHLGLAAAASPLERGYLEVLNVSEVDPDRALRLCQAIIVLHEGGSQGGEADPQAAQFLELARREAVALRQEIGAHRAAGLSVARRRLDEARTLWPSDPQAAEAICRSVLQLYEDKFMAEEVVAAARGMIEEHLEGDGE